MPTHVKGTSCIILGEPGKYYGWPSVTCTPQGQLIAVVSGNREGHICPYGQTLLVRSTDQGATWSPPQLVNDTPLDDRDAGILALRDGTLVLNWLTSLAFEEVDVETQYGPAFLPRWHEHVAKITQQDRARWLGNWCRRSTDGGHTWEEPVSTILTAPHGGIELSDGRLLMLGNDTPEGRQVVAAVESLDQGRSWHLIGNVPIPEGKQTSNFSEAHLVETPQGPIIAHFRYENWSFEHDVAWQTESHDGGKSWTMPHPTLIRGHPPHLLLLRNGWLLNTHGYRHPPFGQRACVSRDGGKTWDVENELIIRDDGPHRDLGYPATAQLPDGSLYTVYYQAPRAGALCVLMGTHWRLEGLLC